MEQTQLPPLDALIANAEKRAKEQGGGHPNGGTTDTTDAPGGGTMPIGRNHTIRDERDR